MRSLFLFLQCDHRGGRGSCLVVHRECCTAHDSCRRSRREVAIVAGMECCVVDVVADVDLAARCLASCSIYLIKMHVEERPNYE
jgi:hypothetical protein